MKRSILSLLCSGGVLLATGAQAAQILPYAELPMKYPTRVSWDSQMKGLWTGWKSRFLSGGLVKATDPSGNSKNVSEGQSYAMLMAVWMNDQTTFNTVWAATESGFWTGKWYRWVAGDGNYATDADQDIAGALIFASALVDKGLWTDYKLNGTTSYKDKAKTVVASISTNMVNGGKYVDAGDWLSDYNPSYLEVHWYRVFKEFAAANSVTTVDWDNVITGSYEILNAQPSASKGMARNFSSQSGGPAGQGDSKPSRNDMGFDAIRVPFRVGLHGMWYHHPKAQAWLKGVWSGGVVSADQPGMYKLDGNPTLWGWCDPPAAAAGTCTSEYEQFFTRLMWGASATGIVDSFPAATTAYTAMASNISSIIGSRDYLAYYDDNTTSKPSANYYAQSLGLMGALAMSGRAANVWDDLKNPWTPPDTAAKISTALKSSQASVYLTGTGTPDTTIFTATLSKPAVCTLYLAGVTSGAKYKYVAPTAGITSLSVKWTPKMIQTFTSKVFAGGETVNATLAIPGAVSLAASAQTSVTIKPGLGVTLRSVTATRAQWIGSELVLPEGVLRGATQATIRIRDARGHVVSSAVASVRNDGSSTRLSVARPSGLTGVLTLDVTADGQAYRASLAAF